MRARNTVVCKTGFAFFCVHKRIHCVSLNRGSLLNLTQPSQVTALEDLTSCLSAPHNFSPLYARAYVA